MASSAVLNIRLPEDLKRHGNQVLERNGISTSEAVRKLYEYLESEQDIPEFMNDCANARQYDNRRRALRTVVGSLQVPDGFNLDDLRQERFDEKYGDIA